MYNGGGDFKNISYQSRLFLLQNLYTMINEFQITITSVGIQKHLIRSTFPEWELLKTAWIFITERFDRYISDHGNNSDKGIIVIDKSSRSSDQVATSVINCIRQNGSNT